jgi:hypothetical protein
VLEPVEALVHVRAPEEVLAVLAVADDVDADLGLPAHDVPDARLQIAAVGLLVVGLPFLLRNEERT